MLSKFKKGSIGTVCSSLEYCVQTAAINKSFRTLRTKQIVKYELNKRLADSPNTSVAR